MQSLPASVQLGKDERLLWEGQPSFARLPAGTKALAAFGWVMGAGCAVVLLLGLGHLGEMEGFFAFWLALVVVNGAGGLGLALILPRRLRRNFRRRRYAVTDRNLIVVHADGRVRRHAVRPEMRPELRVEARKVRRGGHDILYEFPPRREVTRPGRAGRRTVQPRPRGFRGLTDGDAQAALAAIRAAQSG